MAKKIKFPLSMKNDVLVKDLNELRENFDLDKAVSYFLDGKLLRWLEARYYDTETEAIKNLNKDSADFKQQLCNIFDVDFSAFGNTDTDFDAVAEHNRKLTALKQYTSDSNLLAKVDSVAFNQEDLADLLDEDVHDIYLCNNSFVIPLRVENKRYIGIGKVEAVINSGKRIDFKSLRIEFENINFDPAYAKLHEKTADELYNLGKKATAEQNYGIAFEYYQKAANLGHIDAMFALSDCYRDGHGVKVNPVKTVHILKKIMKMNNYRARAIFGMGLLYEYSSTYGVRDINKAIAWYEKSASLGYERALDTLGTKYYSGNNVSKDYHKAKEFYEKIAFNGNAEVMYRLGVIEEANENLPKALEWYEKASANGSAENEAKKSESKPSSYFKAIAYLEKAENLGCESVTIYGFNEYFNSSDRSLDEFNNIVAQEEKSATLGNKFAMCRLGHLYETGCSSNSFYVESNPTKSIEWYEKAANLGSLTASYCLALIFKDSIWFGEEYKSLKKAIKWYEKIAENPTFILQWRLTAMYELAHIYLEGGEAVPRDEQKAAEWYEKLCEANNNKYGFDSIGNIDYFKVLLQE